MEGSMECFQNGPSNVKPSLRNIVPRYSVECVFERGPGLATDYESKRSAGTLREVAVNEGNKEPSEPLKTPPSANRGKVRQKPIENGPAYFIPVRHERRQLPKSRLSGNWLFA
jgi:hypothetical protein